ncbi:MAG: hypothetical protein ABMB14_36230, partial [Myxococcota bacterium]
MSTPDDRLATDRDDARAGVDLDALFDRIASDTSAAPAGPSSWSTGARRIAAAAAVLGVGALMIGAQGHRDLSADPIRLLGLAIGMTVAGWFGAITALRPA